MSKRSVFTTITPLPAFMTKEAALSFLHDHYQMIDLNPLVIERHKLDSPPANASPEECHASWYQITDNITYMPGVQSSVSYNACLHNLADGLQTHTFAPAGVEIRARWLLGGGKGAPSELGLSVPSQGLYLQEETDLKCNFLMTGFIKKNLKKAHGQVVEKIIEKARLQEPRPAVPPKDAGYHSRGSSQETPAAPAPAGQGAPAQQQHRPITPIYAQFATNPNPNPNSDPSSAPNRYPPGYQQYNQGPGQAFPGHQRATSKPEQSYVPYSQPGVEASRPVEMPASSSRPRPLSELPG